MGLEGLDRVRDKINEGVLKKDGIEECTLDADATEIIGEKADALFTYKGNKGYMPLFGFLYENPVYPYHEFREGNVAPPFGQKEFYFECKQRMLRGKRIGQYRGYSASYQAGLFNQLEENGVKCGITVDQDKGVKAAIGLIPRGDWKESVKGCGYELGEAVIRMNETKKAFRLVVKREVRRQGNSLGKKGSIFIIR